MMLEYIGKPVDYDRLLRLLRIEPEYGTPARSIRNLAQLGVGVTYQQGTMEELQAHLGAGRPCIAFVRTGDLPYWHEDSGHAVVVVGMDETSVYLHDPAFEIAPQVVAADDFRLAWLEAGEYFAVIRLSDE